MADGSANRSASPGTATGHRTQPSTCNTAPSMPKAVKTVAAALRQERPAGSRMLFAERQDAEMTTARPTLRERRRHDLVAEIKAVASRQLADEGLGALSLRAVSRDVGMAVSALYRYFASRDELITALLEDAYAALAEAVRAGADTEPDDPVAALTAGLIAFRAWSVTHPAEYGLMFGVPLPGYSAPPERLVEVGTRAGATIYALVHAADQHGRLDPDVARRRVEALPPESAAQLDEWRLRRMPHMSLAAVALTVDLWVRTQGFLSLEVFGQLRPVLPDASAAYDEAVRSALRDAGLGSA